MAFQPTIGASRWRLMGKRCKKCKGSFNPSRRGYPPRPRRATNLAMPDRIVRQFSDYDSIE